MGWPGQDFISLQQLRHDPASCGVSNRPLCGRTTLKYLPRSESPMTVFRPKLEAIPLNHHAQLKVTRQLIEFIPFSSQHAR